MSEGEKFELKIGNKQVGYKKVKVWIEKGSYSGAYEGVKLMMEFPQEGYPLSQCLGVLSSKGFTTVGLSSNKEIPKHIKLDQDLHIKIMKGEG
jgi:hypothetical protein